jgi:hypothetical protein
MLIDWLHFFWGLLIVKTGKRITMKTSYSDARTLVTNFLGFHIVMSGMFFFIFAYDTKEKEHQNTQ